MPEESYNLNSGNGQNDGQMSNASPMPSSGQPHQITPEELRKSQANGMPKTEPDATPTADTPPASPVTAPSAITPSTATPPAGAPSVTPSVGVPAAQTPAPGATLPAPEQPKGEGNAKKYIIITIVVIVLLTGAYFAYSFFMNDSTNDETEESDKKNKLGDDSDKTEPEEDDSEKLEEITEELKDTFGDGTSSDEPTGEKDAPPSLSVGETGSDETKKPETSGTPEISDETSTTEVSDTGDTTEGSATGDTTEGGAANEGSTTSDTTEDEKIFR